jgi:hypothetical protein
MTVVESNGQSLVKMEKDGLGPKKRFRVKSSLYKISKWDEARGIVGMDN